jgi:hypothetical protein
MQVSTGKTILPMLCQFQVFTSLSPGQSEYSFSQRRPGRTAGAKRRRRKFHSITFDFQKGEREAEASGRVLRGNPDADPWHLYAAKTQSLSQCRDDISDATAMHAVRMAGRPRIDAKAGIHGYLCTTFESPLLALD